MVLDLLEELIY